MVASTHTLPRARDRACSQVHALDWEPNLQCEGYALTTEPPTRETSCFLSQSLPRVTKSCTSTSLLGSNDGTSVAPHICMSLCDRESALFYAVQLLKVTGKGGQTRSWALSPHKSGPCCSGLPAPPPADTESSPDEKEAVSACISGTRLQPVQKARPTRRCLWQACWWRWCHIWVGGASDDGAIHTPRGPGTPGDDGLCPT